MNKARIEAYEDLKAALRKCHEAGMPICVSSEHNGSLESINGVSIGDTEDGRKGVVLESALDCVDFENWGDHDFNF